MGKKNKLSFYVTRHLISGLYENWRQEPLLQPARPRPHRVHLGQRRVPHSSRQRNLARLHHRKRNVLINKLTSVLAMKWSSLKLAGQAQVESRAESNLDKTLDKTEENIIFLTL